MDLYTRFTHLSMWGCYHQYRQAENAHGQMQYAYNLCEQIFTMLLSAKPPNWPQWDHMIENSFELFTSWAIAEKSKSGQLDCGSQSKGQYHFTTFTISL